MENAHKPEIKRSRRRKGTSEETDGRSFLQTERELVRQPTT
jgi:hypothetical protein